MTHSGRIVDSGSYLHGKKEGEWKEHFEMRSYKNGVPHGFWQIGSGGHLHSASLSGEFDTGKKTGEWKMRESSYHGGLIALHTLTYSNDSLIDSVREYTEEFEEYLSGDEDGNSIKISQQVGIVKVYSGNTKLQLHRLHLDRSEVYWQFR